MPSLFLTPEEVYERYRGAISLGTLCSWRMMKIAPSFLKLGRAVLYPTVTFYFCPHCGSTVYWEPRRKPEIVAVAVGAFADPAFPAPSQAVYAEHRHIWVPNLPPG